MNDLLNGMFGKIAPGMCRLSMEGGIAIHTGEGYKFFDEASGRMVKCDNFVFPIGEEFFFVIPSNRVKKGDIILANGKPKYVMEADKSRITALNYENSVIETILPERYMFLGNTYFYGKIVSMFGTKGLRGRGGGGKVMKYLLLSQLLGGGFSKGSVSGGGVSGGYGGSKAVDTNGDMNGMGFKELLPLLLLSGGKDGLFSFDLDEDPEIEEDDTVSD